MNTRLRRYEHQSDYNRIAQFLLETYQPGNRHSNWLQSRWEYMHYHRTKLRFKLIKFMPDMTMYNITFAWYSIDPVLIPSADTIQVDLDNFLSAPCMTNQGITYSIRNIIKVCANIKGGIHVGQPITAAESELIQLDEVHKIFDQEPSIAALQQIASVGLRGLQPLVDAIQHALNSA